MELRFKSVCPSNFSFHYAALCSFNLRNKTLVPAGSNYQHQLVNRDHLEKELKVSLKASKITANNWLFIGHCWGQKLRNSNTWLGNLHQTQRSVTISHVVSIWHFSTRGEKPHWSHCQLLEVHCSNWERPNSHLPNPSLNKGSQWDPRRQVNF